MGGKQGIFNVKIVKIIYFYSPQVIVTQLIRNLGFAFATIAVVNLVLIADIMVSLLVFICVCLTLLDLVGATFFMGLTIEILTSIILILAGMCYLYE